MGIRKTSGYQHCVTLPGDNIREAFVESLGNVGAESYEGRALRNKDMSGNQVSTPHPISIMDDHIIIHPWARESMVSLVLNVLAEFNPSLHTNDVTYFNGLIKLSATALFNHRVAQCPNLIGKVIETDFSFKFKDDQVNVVVSRASVIGKRGRMSIVDIEFTSTVYPDSMVLIGKEQFKGKGLTRRVV